MITRHPPASGALPPRYGSPRLQDDISQSAKHPLYAWDGIGWGWEPFRLEFFHNTIHPSWPQDNVSSSVYWPHATLQLPKPFHLAISLPSSETTYRRPLNALYVLGKNSDRCTTPYTAYGPKTTYRRPQNDRTPPFSFRNPSTSPSVPQAWRRRIVVR